MIRSSILALPPFLFPLSSPSLPLSVLREDLIRHSAPEQKFTATSTTILQLIDLLGAGKKGMEFCHIFGYTYYGDKIYGYKKWEEREGKFEMQKYFLSYYPYTLRYDVGHQILFYSAY